MTLYLKDIVDDKFIKLIPIYIIKRVTDLVNENQYVDMQKYLEDNYHIEIKDVVNQLLTKGFSYNKLKNLVVIRIDENIKEKKTQEKLSTLIRLIDYGNLDVQGIDLIKSSVEYIKSNILNIYRLYQMRGAK